MAETNKFPVVRSIAREAEMGSLQPLIADVRSSTPTLIRPEGTVTTRVPAYVNNKLHLLVVPDLVSQSDAPSVVDIPTALLRDSFLVTARAAEIMAKTSDATRIDIGWNFSVGEKTKRIASQPDNLHIHVFGYEPDDFTFKTAKEVHTDAILRSKISEPMDKISQDIIDSQVLLNTPDFYRVFSRLPDNPSTFYLKSGLDAITNPDFALLIQQLHDNGQKAYNDLAGCFVDLDKPRFDRYDRLMPLPIGQRRANLMHYISTHDGLSDISYQALSYIADQAVSFEELVDQKAGRDISKTEVRDLLYARGAINGFAYSMRLSGEVQADRNFGDWQFNYHPVVFSSQDVLMDQLFERDETASLSEIQLARLTGMEQVIRMGIK